LIEASMNSEESKAMKTFRPSGFHRLRHCQRVGRGLLDDPQPHRRIAVDAHDAALVLGAQLGAPDVLQPDRIAARLGDDEVVELLGRPEVGLGQHRELALAALDAARRHLDILAPQGDLDVERR